MKNCKNCNKEIIKTNPRANNVLFCSVQCRNRFTYKRYTKQWAINKRLADASEPADHKIQCAICEKWYVQVGSHVWNTHKMRAREYREQYGFDVKRGQTKGEYRELKAEQAFLGGGVKNLLRGVSYWFKKGQPGVGEYQRSEETMERLKEQAKKLPHGKIIRGK